jgi:hypothetical protein
VDAAGAHAPLRALRAQTRAVGTKRHPPSTRPPAHSWLRALAFCWRHNPSCGHPAPLTHLG